ncbi:MAG: HD domain-containing protein [Lachnospiraceae bacterium]|nr:HD domain-containing protein [Lachnospiraceae bacterium]
MFPKREEAERLLKEGEARNPGPWGSHSRTVAACAERIAAGIPGLDPEKAYVVGLLHDIGRREGVTNFAHIIDGYRFLMGLGYDEAAKICITHSFAVPDIRMHVGNMDISEEDREELIRLIREYEYDDYDRLIQLCDSIAFPGQVVDLETRMDDVERRYGSYPQEKREKNRELKAYFEKKMGRNLYEALDCCGHAE